MRLFLLFFACLICTVCRAQTGLRVKLPEEIFPQLQEIIDSALEKSEVAIEREMLETEARGRRISARSAVLPSLSSSIALRQERDQDTVEDARWDERVIYNLTLSQPLYHWGARKSQKDIGKILYDKEELSSQQAITSLVKRIRSTYMGLVVAKQNLERSRLDLQETRANFDFQQSQIELGQASSSSILPYEFAVSRDELDELRKSNDWESRLLDLSQLTGMAVSVLEDMISNEIPEVETLDESFVEGLDSLVETAVANDENVQKLAMDLEIERKRLLITKHSLKPKIDAQVGLSSNAIDLDGTRREQSFAYMGFSVRWSIFDGFNKKGDMLEATTRLARKERAKKVYEENLARSLRNLVKSLDIERRGLAIEERNLAAVSGRFQWVSRAFEEERVPQSDLTKASKDLQNTSIRTQSSRISYLLAVSELVAELGLD